jgi:FlaA1/EpsC-like NDP-sugar epimerase
MSEPTLEPVFAEKVVMITGAGGTIGQELTQQILSQRPAKLVLFDHSEIALYTAEKDLRARALAADVALVPVLGSVGDERQVRGTLSRHGVEAVLHAASYKHVPLIESNPAAAVVNNVFGTRTLALAARDYGVGHFIYLSSEKASQPDGVMAATKRLAESVVLDIAERAQHTRYSVVRFGNVLNSSGSVIPLFEDQIAKGGPITLTDEEVSRFFISVSEAAHLVLAAASRSVGGELFTLDMGTAVQIQALARSMIESAGLTVRDSETPNGDIEIAEIGLRAGDSLHNAQSIAAGMVTTDHQRILKAQPALLSEIEVAKALRDLGAALDSQNEDAIADVLLRKVAEAEPQNADREAR